MKLDLRGKVIKAHGEKDKTCLEIEVMFARLSLWETRGRELS